jgi:DNA polymerase-3 subunit beta
MSWKSGSITLPGTSGLSYPAAPELAADRRELEFDSDVLLAGISKTLFATADDELRPVMNGVFIDIAPEHYIFVATDAHKLVKYAVDTEGGAVTASFILPKKPANLLRNILVKESDKVKVGFDSKNVMFTLRNSTLICRLIEGNYPNYNAVIPVNNPNKVIVDRMEFLNAIKRVAVCSNQATNLIKLDITNNLISLTAQDLDYSYSAKESLPCSYEGDLISIGFKSTFLVEILANVETPSVLVELADSTRSGVFKPLYDDKQSSSTLMILMPMLINA